MIAENESQGEKVREDLEALGPKKTTTNKQKRGMPTLAVVSPIILLDLQGHVGIFCFVLVPAISFP